MQDRRRHTIRSHEYSAHYYKHNSLAPFGELFDVEEFARFVVLISGVETGQVKQNNENIHGPPPPRLYNHQLNNASDTHHEHQPLPSNCRYPGQPLGEVRKSLQLLDDPLVYGVSVSHTNSLADPDVDGHLPRD